MPATISGSQNGTVGLINSFTAASASGVAIGFVGIPSAARRITVMLNNVSTAGTSNLQLRVGSGSFSTSGYVSNANYVNDSPSSNTSTGLSSSTGFILVADTTAAQAYYGVITLNLLGSNIWVCAGTGMRTPATQNGCFNSGAITLAGALDRIQLTTVNGTDTFDSGNINILYE